MCYSWLCLTGKVTEEYNWENATFIHFFVGSITVWVNVYLLVPETQWSQMLLKLWFQTLSMSFVLLRCFPQTHTCIPLSNLLTLLTILQMHAVSFKWITVRTDLVPYFYYPWRNNPVDIWQQACLVYPFLPYKVFKLTTSLDY